MLIAALSLMLAAAADRPANTPQLELHGVVVEAVYPGQVGSGVLAVWSRVRVRTAEGTAMDVFSLHMDEGKDDPPLPGIGQRCDIRYRMGTLGGSVGAGLDTARPWAMADAYDCTGPSRRTDGGS